MGVAGTHKFPCALSKEWLLIPGSLSPFETPKLWTLRPPWTSVEGARTGPLVVLCHPCFLLRSWGGLTLHSPVSALSVKKTMTWLHPAHLLLLVSHPLPTACFCLSPRSAAGSWTLRVQPQRWPLPIPRGWAWGRRPLLAVPSSQRRCRLPGPLLAGRR